MTLFSRAPQTRTQALKWLVVYSVANLLIIGTVFRFYLNSLLQGDEPWIPELLAEIDQVLIFSFWALLGIALIFSVVFVSVFFGPLGSLIEKAKSILRGDLSIKKSDIIKESRGEWYQLDLFLNKIWKDLKRKKEDVARERGELEAIITAANDAILAVDSDMNIRYYNAPMALMFDQKEEGSWGKKLTEVVRSQKIVETFQRAMKELKSQWVEAQQELSIDSSIHYFKVSISPLLDEKKAKARGAVAIFHDITDHKKVEKVRMDFVANASHELKTPLTSIQGYFSHIKSQCSANDELQESFTVVENNMNRLNSIIQDLLQLSKIESAESVTFTDVPVLEATEQVIHDLKGHVKEKNQSLLFTYDIDVVRTNIDLLEHVLMNLIENAVKYSPQDAQIKITWGQKASHVFLSVKDSGPGIESFHQGRLFERFYRVRDETNHSHKGTGLGLSIVRNCMQKLGGTVDVKSAPGLGSEFICYFPR